jgi:hypothetical protein
MAAPMKPMNKTEVGVQLIGWGDARREKISGTRLHPEKADVDKIIAACKAQMGEVAFSDAYDAGQKMSLEEAVEYTLNEN